MKKILLCLCATTVALGNPYPDPNAVPRDRREALPPVPTIKLDPSSLRLNAVTVLRVDVGWSDSSGFSVAAARLERSGTPALLRRTAATDPLGSFRGELVRRSDGTLLSSASVGTGVEMRNLTRALSFRFPEPEVPVDFRLVAENDQTGVMEEVLRESVEPSAPVPSSPPIDVRLVHAAKVTPSLLVNVYAEGYLDGKKDRFFQDAARLAKALTDNKFPGAERFEIRAVWAPSAKALGAAKNLGLPVEERDSFLGLYFPFWRNFGRWYNVVYPTRETRYRDAVGLAPYDYPMVLIDDGAYWGVGNFNELTAIPSRHASFTYLLLHEFGHFFGLNEEYEGGGRTELEFAAGIDEPWSQNITFLRDTTQLKWRSLVKQGTTIPTPKSEWEGNGPYGAYRGGYADSAPTHTSHKPGFDCTMESGKKFCPICRSAIEARVRHDLGE